jgi:hypothetical protein
MDMKDRDNDRVSQEWATRLVLLRDGISIRPIDVLTGPNREWNPAVWRALENRIDGSGVVLMDCVVSFMDAWCEKYSEDEVANLRAMGTVMTPTLGEGWYECQLWCHLILKAGDVFKFL